MHKVTVFVEEGFFDYVAGRPGEPGRKKASDHSAQNDAGRGNCFAEELAQ